MKSRTHKSQPDEDAELLRSIIAAMMEGLGRGGLSWMARKLGTTPSNLRKRMQSNAGAFDAITLRASLLALSLKAEKFAAEPVETVKSGKFLIEIREDEEGNKPTWKKL